MSKNEQYRSFPGQFKNEEVLFSFRRHPVVMRKGLILMMGTILLGGIAGLFTTRNVATFGEFLLAFFEPIAFAALVGSLFLFYYWIGWHYSVCIVTSERFLQFNQKGIFKSRSVNHIPLDRILSVNYQVKGMVETLLGFGTIIIQTMVGDFVIAKVPKPADTQANIVSAIKESGVTLREEAEFVEE